jgi:hypothetical protein
MRQNSDAVTGMFWVVAQAVRDIVKQIKLTQLIPRVLIRDVSLETILFAGHI